MTRRVTDWELGIKPTLDEINERMDRIRGYIADCNDIVDELFPPENPKVDSMPTQARWQSKTRK